MFKINTRILNALEILRGPYQKRDQIQVTFDDWSTFAPKKPKHFVLDSFSHDQNEIGYSSELNVKAYIKDGRVFIQTPPCLILKRATLFGWETFWNGKDLFAQGGEKSHLFEITLPSFGWWRLSSFSHSVDIAYFTSNKRSFEWKVFFKEIFTSQLNRLFLVAGAVHLGLFFTFFHFDSIKHEIISIMKNDEKIIQEQEQRASLGSQVPVAIEMVEAAFQGISIFSVLNREANKNFVSKDLTQNLKSLVNLFKSRPVAEVQKKVFQPGTNSQAGLSQTFKSLQNGLLARQGGQGSGGVEHSSNKTQKKGIRDVHWKSQFLPSGSGKGQSLSEGQQQLLYESFSKLQDRFRGCYETALLKFEEMTVTVSFEAEINPEGFIGSPRFSLSGRYTPDSQEALLNCLKTTLTKTKIDPKLSGIKVKNQFIFKS